MRERTRVEARRARRALSALVAIAALGAAPSARADDGDRARSDARALAEKGDAAFGSGRCDKAIGLWTKAEETFHAPTILVRIARCQALLGRVVDATASLRRVVEAPLAADAPAPWVEAQGEAKRDLPEVEARIAKLRVNVVGHDILAPASLQVDDVATSIGTAFPIDPGPHRLRVVSKEATWERTVTLDDGETQSIDVQLVIMAPLPPSRTTRNVGFAFGALGVASIGVGAAFAVSAMSASGTLDGQCGPDRKACPSSAQSDIDRVRAHSLVADFAIGGGLALASVGTGFVFAGGKTKTEPATVKIVAALGSIALRGSL